MKKLISLLVIALCYLSSSAQTISWGAIYRNPNPQAALFKQNWEQTETKYVRDATNNNVGISLVSINLSLSKVDIVYATFNNYGNVVGELEYVTRPINDFSFEVVNKKVIVTILKLDANATLHVYDSKDDQGYFIEIVFANKVAIADHFMAVPSLNEEEIRD